VCCVGRCAVQICSRCLQSPSSRRYRGSCCRLTPKPPRTFLRHLPSSNNCCCTSALPLLLLSCLLLRHHLLYLNLLPAKEALGIWKLTLTVCCFREREQAASPCFGWLGREWDSALPFWPVLFSLHPNKDTRQLARRTDKKPK